MLSDRSTRQPEFRVYSKVATPADDTKLFKVAQSKEGSAELQNLDPSKLDERATNWQMWSRVIKGEGMPLGATSPSSEQAQRGSELSARNQERREGAP